MAELHIYLPSILLSYLTYLVIIASPGPATLAIMSISMNLGRTAGFIFGLGIVSGSVIWGALAFSGLAKLLHIYSYSLSVLKIVGGLYLLWMAYEALRSVSVDKIPQSKIKLTDFSPVKIYIQALLLHLTNPKAALTWLAIVSISEKEAVPSWVAITTFSGCIVLIIFICTLYSFLFSSKVMIARYKKAKRPIEIVMILVFSVAGLTLISDGLLNG